VVIAFDSDNKITLISSYNTGKSCSRSLILGAESESRCSSAGVGISSPKFSYPGVGVGVPQKYKDSASLIVSKLSGILVDMGLFHIFGLSMSSFIIKFIA